MRLNRWEPPRDRESDNGHPLDDLLFAQERISRAPNRDAQIIVARAALNELQPIIEGMDGVRVEIEARDGFHYGAYDYSQLQVVRDTDLVVLGSFDNLVSLDLTQQYGSVGLGIALKGAAMWTESGTVVDSNPFLPTFTPVSSIKSIEY